MEQIDTNKEAVATTLKKEIAFWNKPSTRVFIFIGIVLMVVGYFTHWLPREKCITEISYIPATETVAPIEGYAFSGKQGKSEHYSYQMRDFKTKGEALSYCLSNR
jgi:hypothetical protein